MKISKYKILENLYRCECGKEFDNPQSLNAHLSHCEYHHNCIGTEMKKRPHEINHTMSGWKKFDDNYKKILHQKSTDTLKNKIENGEIISFWKDPNIPDESKQTYKNKISKVISKLREDGKIYCRGLMGYYKGIHCDSSWELAYLIYCLDHNIPIKRCNIKFPYVYKNEEHIYTPDFIINNNKIIEIKGFKDIRWSIKKKCCYENNIEIIDENKIKPYIEYVKNKYGKDFIKLYELN